MDTNKQVMEEPPRTNSRGGHEKADAARGSHQLSSAEDAADRPVRNQVNKAFFGAMGGAALVILALIIYIFAFRPTVGGPTHPTKAPSGSSSNSGKTGSPAP